MTYELTSGNFNTAAIELSYLENQGVGDASGLLQAYMGGAMVQEYDAQIQMFTAELTAVNAEKSAVRADKLAVTGLQSNLKTFVASGENVAYFPDGTVYEGEAAVLGSNEVANLREQAASLGVSMNDPALLNGSNNTYAVDVKFLEDIEGALDNKLTDLNSISEMKSIQFQSLMDARKQSMIMLSNLINSDHETKMSIIQNLKG